MNSEVGCLLPEVHFVHKSPTLRGRQREFKGTLYLTPIILYFNIAINFP